MGFLETVNEFRNLGCMIHAKLTAAARVYEDLKFDNFKSNLEKHYDADLELLYLHMKELESGDSIVLPYFESEVIHFEQINCFQRSLANSTQLKFILAVCDNSSNILYYQLEPSLRDK
ncbi:tRNA splicing endonuclease subunit 15 [Haematobia irritans]|uniref:tRNA splicing endonuclease subunit 15 n=1 Tax=Haematobia irritans TaxID=7368 RepID=UPI003F4FAFC9